MLDNYATVAEAVDSLEGSVCHGRPDLAERLSREPPPVDLGSPTGNSAVFEYVDGKLSVHHGKQYQVMTNEPPMDQQAALNAYWKTIGGQTFLPGTIKPEDRFVRASYFINAIPKTIEPALIQSVPAATLANQAAASVLSVMRTTSTPFGLHTRRRAEQLLDVVADRRRPEEPRLFLRQRHQPQRVLGVACRSRLQRRRPDDEAHHGRRQGLRRRRRPRASSQRPLPVPSGFALVVTPRSGDCEVAAQLSGSYNSLPMATAVSSMRLEKPHSLSYQDITRTSLPSTTCVCVESKLDENGEWLKSIDTSSSVT